MSLDLKLGSHWTTRGGWKATVVWIKRGGGVIAVHQHETDYAINHSETGKGIGVSSRCDLVSVWIDKPAIRDWPKWAKAAAMDSDGEWYWFDGLPTVHHGHGMWWPQTTFGSSLFHPSEVPTWEGDWKNSLVVKEESR